MNRKVIYILGGLLVVILVLAGVILTRSKKPSTTNNQQQTSNQNQNGNNQSQSSKMVKISDTPAISPVITSTDDAIWYFTPAGKLYKINLSSGLKKEYLLPQDLTVSDVIWPLNGNDFIVVTETALAGKTFNYYNSDTKTYTQYSKNIKGVAFSPDGKKIIYNWVADNGASSLSEANPDASGHQLIMDLPDGNYDVKVSSHGQILLSDYTKPANGKLLLTDLTSKKLITIQTGNSNAAKWSPDGNYFLFNEADNTNSTNNHLWIGDANSSNGNKDTGVVATADQGAFNSSDQVVVASNGTIYQIDPKTLNKATLLASDNAVNIDPKQVIPDDSGTAVFFVNSDGYLYRGDLEQ